MPYMELKLATIRTFMSNKWRGVGIDRQLLRLECRKSCMSLTVFPYLEKILTIKVLYD